MHWLLSIGHSGMWTGGYTHAFKNALDADKAVVIDVVSENSMKIKTES